MSWHESGADPDCVLGREAAELLRRVPPFRKNFLLPSSDKSILNPYKPQSSHSNTVWPETWQMPTRLHGLAHKTVTVTVTFLSLESQISQSG
jgi:hypothetical protein